MLLLDRISLSRTVDLVNEAAFFRRPIPLRRRGALARWLASRYGRPGAYLGTFALFDDERREGVRLFTGERTFSAAARHIAAQETCRALRLLAIDDRPIDEALTAATSILAQHIGPVRPRGPVPGRIDWLAPYAGGTYCCGRCSVALWRHIIVGGFDDPQHRLRVGLRCLAACRRGEGQWRSFPFWYTLSALIEMDVSQATTEIRYAAPLLKRTLAAPPRQHRFAERRREIARLALDRI